MCRVSICLIGGKKYVRARKDNMEGQTCSFLGMADITSASECEAAAAALPKYKSGAMRIKHKYIGVDDWSDNPKGCYAKVCADDDRR